MVGDIGHLYPYLWTTQTQIGNHFFMGLKNHLKGEDYCCSCIMNVLKTLVVSKYSFILKRIIIFAG
jgi:hypothetical protein